MTQGIGDQLRHNQDDTAAHRRFTSRFQPAQESFRDATPCATPPPIERQTLFSAAVVAVSVPEYCIRLTPVSVRPYAVTPTSERVPEITDVHASSTPSRQVRQGQVSGLVEPSRFGAGVALRRRRSSVPC